MTDDRPPELATLWVLNRLRCALTPTENGWELTVWDGAEIVCSRVIGDGQEALEVAEVWRQELS
jgi:hypothetical protein